MIDWDYYDPGGTVLPPTPGFESRIMDNLFVLKMGLMLMVTFYTAFHTYITFFFRVHLNNLSH
jgi:hypothetical protein